MTRFIPALVALASLASGFAGCTAIFPDRDGQDTRGGGTTGGEVPIPTPNQKAQFGSSCQLKTDLIEDNCIAPDQCQLVSRDLGATMCSRTCQNDAGCPGGSRCTDTPAGRICVPTCTQDFDCQVTLTGGRCIPVTATAKVCWTADAVSGEVRSEAEPVLDRIQLLRKGAFSYEPGLPTPGADVQLRIDLRNKGLRDIQGMSATLTPEGSASQIQAFSGGAVQNLTVPGFGKLEGALTPTFRLAPELVVGQELKFTVSFRTAAETWASSFAIAAYGPTAQPYVTEVELSDPGGQPVSAVGPGQPVTVRLYGRNVGFGALNSVTTSAEVTSANATLIATPNGPLSLPDSEATTATSLLYQGTVERDGTATGTILVEVQFIDANAGSWTQTLELPVTP